MCTQSDAMKQAADAVEKFSEEKAISKEIKVRDIFLRVSTAIQETLYIQV